MNEQQAAAVRLAYARLFNDNPRPGDAALVFADLANYSSFDGVPGISAWIKQTGTAAGYEISCHEHNGKRAVFERVKNFASLTESEMLQLEMVARAGPAED